MKRMLLPVCVLALSGCVFSNKLSTEKARELLFADLQGGPVGTLVKTVTAHLEIQQIENGATAAASGTIQVQTFQDTYREIGTVELPNHRTLTEIQPVMKAGEQKSINVSARFARDNNGWELSGPAEYSLRLGDLGKSLASFANAVDMTTEAGKKLPALLDEYAQQIKFFNKSNERLSQLNSFYEHSLGSEGINSWGDWNFRASEAQRLFPNELGLEQKLIYTARTSALTEVQRYQLEKEILEPIWKLNSDKATVARDMAKQQAEAIATQLQTYGA